MTIVHVPATVDDVDLSTLSLEELAARAETAHEACERSVGLARTQVEDALAHAVSVGEILLAAHAKMPAGEWKSWVKNNLPFSISVSYVYSRLATFRSEVESWAATSDSPSIIGAFRHLTSAGMARPKGGRLPRHEIDPLFVPQVQALRSQGLSYKEIGKQLGAADATVHRAIDPEYRARRQANQHAYRRRAEAASKALAEKEERDRRTALARNVGGDLSRAYSEVRRLAATIDKALAAADPDQRPAVRDALAYTHKAEDALVAAMKAQR